MSTVNTPDRIARYDIKVMLFGNSILKHGPNEGIGWKPNWGMAASMEERDYVHRLMDFYVKNKYGVLPYTLNQFATFERSIVAEDNVCYTEALAPIKEAVSAYQPNLVNLQMGENVAVSGLTAEQYAEAITQLVRTIQNASHGVKVMLCTPFWGGEAKNKGISLVAERLSLPVSDLSTLNRKENMAIGLFEHGGVASHPGDVGMDNIAKLIFANMDRVISENFTPRYELLTKSIQISCNTDSIAKNGGTLLLSASVFPETANKEILWSVDHQDLAEINPQGMLLAKNDGTVLVTAKSCFNDVFATKTIFISGQTKPFTVTYDAGTTDTVKNLPNANAYAKGNFRLSHQKPLRDCNQFVGWSLSENGEIVDTIAITGAVCVFAVWKLASCWEFTEDSGGILVENGFNVNVLGGKLMAIATGTDTEKGAILRFVSPNLSLPAEKYHTFLLKIQNTVFDTESNMQIVIHTTNGDNVFTAAVTCIHETEYRFYLSGCTGTITGFAIAPTNLDCTVNVGLIRFVGVDL